MGTGRSRELGVWRTGSSVFTGGVEVIMVRGGWRELVPRNELGEVTMGFVLKVWTLSRRQWGNQ